MLNDKKNSSFKDFLTKPLIKADSKAIQYSGLGIQLAVTILVFLFIGVWLDRTFKTEFIFTLILTFMGFGGGFYSFYLTIKRLTEDDKKDKKRKM
jgi:F0F1-type ATP synthase assembly protein I